MKEQFKLLGGTACRFLPLLSLFIACLSGCSTSGVSDKTPYTVDNPTSFFRDVKVDGSFFYRRLAPGDVTTVNLSRSHPHTITIIDFGMFGPADRETRKVKWNNEKQDWDEETE